MIRALILLLGFMLPAVAAPTLHAQQNGMRAAQQATEAPAQTKPSGALAVCSSSHAAAVNLNLSVPRTLVSPNEKWKLLGVPGKNVFTDASVFIATGDGSKKWRIDWLHRRGSAWFSDDSHWLVLRDEFLKNDTSLRAFDLSGDSPREIKHVDSAIRRAIEKQIPKGMAAEWVKYPDVCFADGAPSTFLVLSDTPILPRWSRIKGKPFFLHIVVTLPDANAVATPYIPNTPPPSAAPVIQDDSGLVQPMPPKIEPEPAQPALPPK
jgi:hypothetical protein